MTGYRHSAFRHKCERDGCYIDQLPSWDDIADCFPRGIRPTDIDGMVEINGKFLFMEEKRQGAAPESGQRLALKRLSMNPNTTVALFRPALRSPFELLVFRNGVGSGWEPATRADLLEFFRHWADMADRAA